MTGDNFHSALKWPLIAALIAALWWGVLTVRKVRAAIVAEPGVSYIQKERSLSDDIHPVWVFLVYEVQNEKLIGTTVFVFESHEDCQSSSAEIKKRLGLHMKPACYLRWMKGDRVSEDRVM